MIASVPSLVDMLPADETTRLDLPIVLDILGEVECLCLLVERPSLGKLVRLNVFVVEGK